MKKKYVLVWLSASVLLGIITIGLLVGLCYIGGLLQSYANANRVFAENILVKGQVQKQVYIFRISNEDDITLPIGDHWTVCVYNIRLNDESERVGLENLMGHVNRMNIELCCYLYLTGNKDVANETLNLMAKYLDVKNHATTLIEPYRTLLINVKEVGVDGGSSMYVIQQLADRYQYAEKFRASRDGVSLN